MLGQPDKRGNVKSMDWLQACVLFLFCFPLFFQLSGSIFTAPDAVFDSQGSLLRIPLPISSVFCFIGIALFLRSGNSHFGTGYVFSFFMSMMLSVLVSTSQNKGGVELTKFIHLVQFVLPFFALVLGGLYLTPKSRYLHFEAIVLYVLAIIIPLEVTATIIGGNTLSAKLYFFSLYQHFQYLPVIFCGFYFLAATCFYEKGSLRNLVVLLAPCMGVYLAQSLSITALIFAIYGSVVMLGVLYSQQAVRLALLLISLALVAYLIYTPLVQETRAYSAKFGQNTQIKTLDDAGNMVDIGVTEKANRKGEDEILATSMSQSLSRSLDQRYGYWSFYTSEIMTSPKQIIFGHAVRLDKSRFPGAHNYYLELAYNFGVISLLPFLYLIIISIYRFREALRPNNNSPGLIMLAALVAFFVFVDNFFKAGFSQPYPGMMMFFLWGVLLTRLNVIDKASRQEIDL